MNTNNIEITVKDHGLYLSIETPDYKYGQYYNTDNSFPPNYVKSKSDAVNRFIAFYSRFKD